MRIAVVLLLKAAICMVVGVVLLILPSTALGWFGLEPTPPMLFATRLLGTLYLMVASILYGARFDVATDALHAVVLGVAVGDILGLASALYGIVTNEVSSLAWVIVGLYAFFALAFGYCLLTWRATVHVPRPIH